MVLTTSKNNYGTKSPFFHPSDRGNPKKVISITTKSPGGKHLIKSKKEVIDKEHKAGILGTSSNLIVSIVGAGIVGMPYALKECGFLSGCLMIIISALITEKSLRLLIETAKHIDVQSYETLFEASFGKKGFITMCVLMFLMSYGAMVSYLMIMKDTLSGLLGVDPTNYPMKRTILVISTLIIALPLSSQRDMADLAKTSRISVTFYFIIVSFVCIYSPFQENISTIDGGFHTIITNIDYNFQPTTFFIGLGVMSFAFVCQHSAFIVAGSLEQPTTKRWSYVTLISLGFSGCLALVCGITGYLAFMDKTDGNILLNIETITTPPIVHTLNQVAKAMLLTCMFFVYPMDAFVLRHICMVLVFKGRAAHEGDDHTVLARTDRRIALTFVLYLLTLLPALLVEDLGSVLAVTGAVAGSALSYICPGASYLAVHGSEFIKLVRNDWTWGNPDEKSRITQELIRNNSGTGSSDDNDNNTSSSSSCGSKLYDCIKTVIGRICWYVFLMPIWILIASTGMSNLDEHVEREALKSPFPYKRLGKVKHKHSLSDRAKGLHTPDIKAMKQKQQSQLTVPTGGGGGDVVGVGEMIPLIDGDGNRRDDMQRLHSYNSLSDVVGGNNNKSSSSSFIPPKSSILSEAIAKGGGNLAIGEAIAARAQAAAAAAAGSSSDDDLTQLTSDSSSDYPQEQDTQADFPLLYDFLVAIFFMLFGMIALVAGLMSIFMGG